MVFLAALNGSVACKGNPESAVRMMHPKAEKLWDSLHHCNYVNSSTVPFSPLFPVCQLRHSVWDCLPGQSSSRPPCPHSACPQPCPQCPSAAQWTLLFLKAEWNHSPPKRVKRDKGKRTWQGFSVTSKTSWKTGTTNAWAWLEGNTKKSEKNDQKIFS